MAPETFPIVLHHSEMIAPDVMQLYFETTHPPLHHFTPGQFITFMLPTETGEIKRRSYSIATIKGQSPWIEIAIRYLQGGIASEILTQLTPGQTLQMMGPVGKLVLQEDIGSKRYILLGTGTGIAPYRSMIPELLFRLSTQDDFEVHILEGVQYSADSLYVSDFLKAAEHPRFYFTACLSRDNHEKKEPWERRGYVQHALETLHLNPASDIIYLCGNPSMIDETFALLKAKGFETSKIRREKYISSN